MKQEKEKMVLTFFIGLLLFLSQMLMNNQEKAMVGVSAFVRQETMKITQLLLEKQNPTPKLQKITSVASAT